MLTDDRSPRRRAFSPRALLPALAALTAAAAIQSGVADAATATNVAITAKPAAVTRATAAAFAWKRTGKITSTRCKLDRNRWRACRTSISYRSVKPGVHTFTVQVRGTRTVTRTATWRVDVTAPTAPSVSGGSDAWFAAGVRTIAATGSTDAGGAGMAGYQYHVSTDGGTTWSAPAVQNPVMVSAPGIRLVQFRAVDKAGNVSAWAPVSLDASGTVKIDQTAPGTPVLTGGSLLWQNVASVDVTVGPLSDAGGSGLVADPLTVETSTDGGSTWSAETPAASATVSDEGGTLVRFRSHDAAGNVSQWAQAEVRIDRTAPSDPSLAGGSTSWFDSASMLVSASGSTDGAGSGIAGYQYETSTDGGSTWSPPADGAALGVSDEGETLVRFRAVDNAGLTSGWVQGTVRLDRSAPSAPSLSGTSSTWWALAQVTVSASGSVDAGDAGLDHYEYETSNDGGSGWTAAAPGDTLDVTGEGETLVRFRAVDAAGNASGWTDGPVRIDRTVPTDPTVAGGSASWLNAASASLTASGATDTPGSGIDHYEYETSTDGGSTWSPATSGAAAAISDEGETVVRFRAVDGAGLTSGWVQETVRLDRTAPSAPSVSGLTPGWQSVASVTATASGSTDVLSGLDHYEYEISADGGTTWGVTTAGDTTDVTDEGRTSLRFRAVDAAGNASAWTSGDAWLDRTPPTDPSLAGGSPAWLSQANESVTASGSADGGSGLDSYESETSTDGGSTWSAPAPGPSLAVSAEGETLVRFRAVDVAGLASAWVGATVRLDRTAPTAPSISGSSGSWQNVASVALSASGSTDAGGSGLDHLEYESSTDGGATWSSPTTGASALVSAEGDTLLRFRAVDAAGNTSGWAQGTARIDRSAPSDPTLAGGSLSWSSAASSPVTASGSADAGSGIAGYEYQTSTDGGSTWSGSTAGAGATVSAQGQTLVRFRAIDNAGLTSNWVQATVRLDRTAPTAPTVSGGSSAWQSVASLSLSASGSTDAGGASLSGYEYETSTDGGTTWSAPQSGSSTSVSAEGQTLVRFRAVDGAGNSSSWVQGTAKLDRSAPSDPTVSGGSSAWQSVASLTATASASTDAGSGVAGYEYRTSTDGGTTWSAATAGAIQVGDGRGPDPGAVPGDRQPRPPLELGAGDPADRPHAADRPDRDRRLDVLAGSGVGVDLRQRQHGRRRLRPGRLSVPDVGQRRHDLVGRDGGHLGRRQRRGHHHRPAAVDRRRRQRVGVGAGERGRVEHREARPHRPDGAGGDRQQPVVADLDLGHRHPVRLDRHGRLRPQPLRGADVDQRRHDLVVHRNRNVEGNHGAGRDLGAVPRRRQCRQRFRLDAGDRAARPHRPDGPDDRRRLPVLAEPCLGDGLRDRRLGHDVRPGWVPVPHERRLWLVGDGDRRERRGHRPGHDPGAVPHR